MEQEMDSGLMTFMIVFIIAMIVLIAVILWKRAHTTPEQKRTQEEKDRMIREANIRRKTVVRAEIVTQGSKTKGGHAMTRAVIGGAVAGEIGAAVGALSAKQKTKGMTTFRLWYQDGHSEIKTVEDYSPEWKEYIKLLSKSE